MLRRIGSLAGSPLGDVVIAAALTTYGQVELWLVHLEPKGAAIPATLVATAAGGAARRWRSCSCSSRR